MKEMTRKEFLKLTGASTALLAMTLNRNCITSIFPRKKLPSRC